MSTVRVRIDNNKNTGTNPNTSVTLTTGAEAKVISSLTFDPKPSTLPQVFATNITHDAQGVIVTFEVGTRGNKVEIKAGEYKSITDSSGAAVDISGANFSARKA